MSEPVNYTPHIQFLASAAASVGTPEEFRALIQDLANTTPDEELAAYDPRRLLGITNQDAVDALAINSEAAQAIAAAGGDGGIASGPIGELLQSNDPQLWTSLHQVFSNEAVVTQLQNPQIQQALTAALAGGDTSALSALGLDADAQAAVRNIASANVLGVLGTAQSISLVPPTPPATEPTVTVVQQDGTRINMDTLVEQQGFQAALQQQLGADHPIVTRLAADPTMASTLLGQLNAGGENGPLAGLNLGPTGDAAVAAHVGPRVMEALRNAQTITINGSGDDATITLHNADGTQTDLNGLMLREGVTAVLDQTPTPDSPAFLHALHGNAEFRASFERLIEAEPGALQTMMGFMENGIGLENSEMMQTLLRNPAFLEKMTEIMDEVAARDDVSFEQVAGALQSVAAGNYMQAYGQFNALGLETPVLTSSFMGAALGAGINGGINGLANSFLGAEMGGQLMEFLGPFGEILTNMITGLLQIIAPEFAQSLRAGLQGGQRFETEVPVVDRAGTVGTSPTADFRAAIAGPAEAGPASVNDFAGIRNLMFEADAELGDELEGLEGTPDLRDRFMAHINGLGSMSERLDALAEWRADLAGGQSVRQATLGMGG